MDETSNPYRSPASHSAATGDAKPAKSLVALAWFAFALGMLAFLANYGYPAFMSPTWYFGILPVLSAMTLALAAIGLGLHVSPTTATDHKGLSPMPVLLNLVMVAGCLFVVWCLSRVDQLLVWAILPRAVVSLIAVSMNLWLAYRLHSTTRGRRLLSVAAGLGILQAMTSISDTMFSDW